MPFGNYTKVEAIAKLRIRQEKARQRAKTAPKRKVKRKTKKDYYKQLLEQNKWINKIPYGSHGSTPLQKRYWKLTTDYRRIYEFLRFGRCISCNVLFKTWQEAQGGHYRPYSKCKGIKKFCEDNVFAQCAYCNSRMNEDKFEGGRLFAENIVKRYGKDHLDRINTYTQGEPQKIEIPEIIENMKTMIRLTKELEIQPDYYKYL